MLGTEILYCDSLVQKATPELQGNCSTWWLEKWVLELEALVGIMVPSLTNCDLGRVIPVSVLELSKKLGTRIWCYKGAGIMWYICHMKRGCCMCKERSSQSTLAATDTSLVTTTALDSSKGRTGPTWLDPRETYYLQTLPG